MDSEDIAQRHKRLLDALVGGDGYDVDSGIIHEITRVSWLSSLLQVIEDHPEVKKAIIDSSDDPDSTFEMLREVRALERDAREALLAESSPALFPAR